MRRTARPSARVVVTSRAAQDPVASGWQAFEKLGMQRTRHRNGVLIYLSPSSQTFAILGDIGIHTAAGEQLWQPAAEALRQGLAAGQLSAALIETVTRIGHALQTHFPAETPNPNELADEVVREGSEDESDPA